MHKAWHSRDSTDRLYVLRKEGGRGLTKMDDYVDAEIHTQWIHEKERRIFFITAASNININSKNLRT